MMFNGFQSHEPMGYVGQQVRGREAGHVAQFHPFDELRASWPVVGVVAEVVKERIGIQEDRGTRAETDEGQGDSRIPNSRSVATRRRTSGSPVH
jgi:hypothetical protein